MSHVTPQSRAYSEWYVGFLKRWNDSNGNERMGQAAFNHLHVTHPRLADAIRSGPDDPYYNDAALPEFFGYVAARLETT